MDTSSMKSPLKSSKGFQIFNFFDWNKSEAEVCIRGASFSTSNFSLICHPQLSEVLNLKWNQCKGSCRETGRTSAHKPTQHLAAPQAHSMGINKTFSHRGPDLNYNQCFSLSGKVCQFPMTTLLSPLYLQPDTLTAIASQPSSGIHKVKSAFLESRLSFTIFARNYDHFDS